MAMRVSAKRLQINKASTTIVVAVGVAAFSLTFSLIAARSLIAKQSYHNEVIEARETARDQLDANIAAVDELKVKYAEFVNRQENIIKGSSSGNGDRDGDNARIVLDALPSKYDFPALVSSLEKILVDRNYTIASISGVDDEVNQNGSVTDATSAASPDVVVSDGSQQTQQTATGAVEMPFELGASGDYRKMMDLLQVFRSSIRPIKIQSITLDAGGDSEVQLNVGGLSYFQPERTLNITEEVVQ
jgi:hypothetical protein